MKKTMKGGKNMKLAVGIGIQDFEKFRERKCFYVDKTMFIKEWWENADDVTLITRPRRFGKTINMSMLECFFSNQYEGRGEELFGGLSIWEEKKYRDMQGKYPVIFLSFAGIKSPTYEEARMAVIQNIMRVYEKYNFLRTEGHLQQIGNQLFDSVNLDMSDATAAIAINYMTNWLNQYYGEKVLIFLDEYDTPMQEAYINGYWKEFTSFMRSFFNSTFKTNPYMGRAVMTGITRVSRESIFSDFNNPEVVTTTSQKYETAFGFTEKEVFDALDQFLLSKHKEEVKEWYDGFKFGEYGDIYNPWSILNFIEKRKVGAYWANTSANSLVGKLIQEGNPDVKQIMEDLLEGKDLVVQIDEQIVFNQLNKKRTAIWSLLLASGYLKIVRAPKDCTDLDQNYRLALTNKEVYTMFENMVNEWFEEVYPQYNNFVKALLENDVDYMNEYMNEITKVMFSSFDVCNKPSDMIKPERFYHGFVLGLLVNLSKKYVLTSNRESGFGRYDVMLEPLDKNQNAYVIEFKVFKQNRDKTLEGAVQNALKQIREKQYDTQLLAKGVSKEKIFHYGFAFEGKTVLIGTDE